jgi:hypothetical protein
MSGSSCGPWTPWPGDDRPQKPGSVPTSTQTPSPFPVGSVSRIAGGQVAAIAGQVAECGLGVCPIVFKEA